MAVKLDTRIGYLTYRYSGSVVHSHTCRSPPQIDPLLAELIVNFIANHLKGIQDFERTKSKWTIHSGAENSMLMYPVISTNF